MWQREREAWAGPIGRKIKGLGRKGADPTLEIERERKLG